MFHDVVRYLFASPDIVHLVRAYIFIFEPKSVLGLRHGALGSSEKAH